jgi:sugar lactone lactonase YvrE
MDARLLTLSTFAVLAVSLVPATLAQPGTISTVVGNGYKGRLGIGGPATAAQMYGPSSVAFDKAGNLFIADYTGEQIYKVDAAGDISIFAGSGAGGYSGNGGKAIDATFNQPVAIAFGPGGDLYVADSNNNVIREIAHGTHIISTAAGNAVGAGPGDVDICGTLVPGVKATATPICNSQGVAVDSKGNLYIHNANAGAQILKVNATTGILTVVAGTGTYGYTGDGGLAVNAQLSWVEGVAVDSSDNIYISDTGNCAIRKVTASTGIITSLVGVPLHPWQGTCGLGGDEGPATAALIDDPWGVVVDQYGDVFFADYGNNLIRVISASGIISTVAGSYTNGVGNSGYSGDGGPATAATLSNPSNPTLDTEGNLYFADSDNFVIRKVSKVSPLP